MKDTIKDLEPRLLWEHFYHITQIPRCSGHEDKIREHVIKIAERNGLTYKVDTAGNMLVKKPAVQGLTDRTSVALQSHLDMVCEKNSGVEHDFSKDPIRVKKEGSDWIAAEGTTLGADNGIGVATALAVLESKDLQHGPLEFLFTVEEETGLSGIRRISGDMLDSRIALNLDSEEDDTFYIGCAGGKTTEPSLTVETEAKPNKDKAVLVKVCGLSGGHSGLNIHEGRANAIKLLTRFLWKVLPQCNARLAIIEGGRSQNAIPREAKAVLYLPEEKLPELKKEAADYQKIFKDEYKYIDPGILVSVEETGFNPPSAIFTVEFQNRCLNLLLSILHGVITMDLAIPGLTQTSTNLGVVKMEGGELCITTKQRSSVDSEMEAASNMVHACGLLANAKVQFSGEYPAWQPNLKSSVLQTAKAVYRDLFNEEPEIKTMHAGLECGVISNKFPGVDVLSIGPIIRNAHSPDEKVQISSVLKFWSFLRSLLQEIATS